MDLKDLTPNLDDLVVEIKHPSTGDNLLNDDGTNMTIIVFAPHSKEYKKVQHEQINKRLRKAQKNKTQDIDYSDIEESTIDLLSKVTKSWSVTFDKEMPKLSVAKAKEVYTDVFWLRDQIEEVVGSSMDFTRG